MLRKKNGITLIALVVTIIVLLILAAVSISAVVGENGIAIKAKNSKIQTRAGNVKEARDLWWSEQDMDRDLDENNAQTLEEVVNDLVSKEQLTEDEKDQILGNEEKGIKATGKVTIGTMTIVFNRYPMQVGDYVDYIPDSNTYDGDLTYSGTDNPEFTTEELSWRVLEIEDDKLVLISEYPTYENALTLYGADGYNNAVYLLNDLCKQLYSKQNIATARSIKIEDITKHAVNENTNYGVTDRPDYTLFPTITRYEKNQNIDGSTGNLSVSEQDELCTGYDFPTSYIEDMNTVVSIGSVSSFNDYDDTTGYSLYADLLIRGEYWIASRCVSQWIGMYAYYDVQYASESDGVSYAALAVKNSGHFWDDTLYLRPVVEVTGDVEFEWNEENQGDSSFPDGLLGDPWLSTTQKPVRKASSWASSESESLGTVFE